MKELILTNKEIKKLISEQVKAQIQDIINEEIQIYQKSPTCNGSQDELNILKIILFPCTSTDTMYIYDLDIKVCKDLLKNGTYNTIVCKNLHMDPFYPMAKGMGAFL